MATTLKVKKRCNYCLKPVRADGTCQNQTCPRYVPGTEAQDTPQDVPQEQDE
jgi:hypothetical protein